MGTRVKSECRPAGGLTNEVQYLDVGRVQNSHEPSESEQDQKS